MMMATLFKPLNNRVLVQPQKQAEETPSGIIIPPSAQGKGQGDPYEATVLGVGDGDDVNVKPGDLVVCPSFSGAEIKLDGVVHYVIEAKDILAVVEVD
jgi:chaperonin GroES